MLALIIFTLILLSLAFVLYIYTNRKKRKFPFTLIDTKDKLVLFSHFWDTHKDSIRKIGIDTEYYQINHRTGRLCLIQIAFQINNNNCNSTMSVFLFDTVKLTQDDIKSALISPVLENENIQKIFHACTNDIDWLYEEFGIVMKNIYDTQEAYQLLSHTNKSVGLNDLILLYFPSDSHKIFKKALKKSFQRSNWMQRPLTRDQLDYAASDCYYLISLQEKIETELYMKKKCYEHNIVYSIEKCIGENEKMLSNENFGRSKISTFDDQKTRNQMYKLQKKLKGQKLEICQGPVYENCIMLTPDGEKLCLCDSKKMNWYIQKNLAVLESENPPCFRLLFEPRNRGYNNDNSAKFYLSPRQNICVICGASEALKRFHVVPLIYLRFLGDEYKAHNSHDVVLMCLACYEPASKVYQNQREEIEQKYGIPKINTDEEEKDDEAYLVKMISLSRALCVNKGKIPQERQREIKNEILEAYLSYQHEGDIQHDSVIKHKFECQMKQILTDLSLPAFPLKEEDLNEEFLLRLKDVKVKQYQGDGLLKHGEMLVKCIKDYREFIREWRIFFLEKFTPKFLGESWDVNHDFYATSPSESKYFKK